MFILLALVLLIGQISGQYGFDSGRAGQGSDYSVDLTDLYGGFLAQPLKFSSGVGGQKYR